MQFVECECSDCRASFKIVKRRNVSETMKFTCPVCQGTLVSCKKIDEDVNGA